MQCASSMALIHVISTFSTFNTMSLSLIESSKLHSFRKDNNNNKYFFHNHNFLLLKKSSSKFNILQLSSSNSEPVLIEGPPSDYDFRKETYETSREIIQRLHPELCNLVDEGTLIAVPRPLDYIERRSDGYREPEMVYLVGTSHVSEQSVQDVKRVIKTIKPDNVVVELCRSRSGLMYEIHMNDPLQNLENQKSQSIMSLGGENFSSAIFRTLKLGGRSALAIRLILNQIISKKVSSQFPFGAEFYSAREAAEEVNAQIVLGDRPIEITLSRAWKMLTWQEKIRLLSALILSDPSKINGDDLLASVKSDDVLSFVFDQMSLKFPSLMQPLVYERDIYLAWSLKRSKAVNGCQNVVGVIGRGHLKGIIYALKQNSNSTLRFRDLVGSHDRNESKDTGSQIWNFCKNLFIDLVVGWLLWIAYDYLCNFIWT